MHYCSRDKRKKSGNTNTSLFCFRSYNNMSIVLETDRKFKCFSRKANKFLLWTKPVMNADYIRKKMYSSSEKPLQVKKLAFIIF